jgi:hypothetical protein
MDICRSSWQNRTSLEGDQTTKEKQEG